MIHSAETIERIRELLIKSGVPKGEALEEMTDHYLSDIESQIASNNNTQSVILSTFQKIEKTDFSTLKKNKKLSSPFILISILLLFLSFYVYQNNFNSKHFKLEERSKDLAPEGWPLPETIATVTSNFGLRMHPILKSPRLHKGIDIKARLGTPVQATGDAVVFETGFTEKCGKYIILKHNRRFSSRYNHLSAICVDKNDIVSKGNLIGEVGNSGMSLGHICITKSWMERHISIPWNLRGHKWPGPSDTSIHRCSKGHDQIIFRNLDASRNQS